MSPASSLVSRAPRRLALVAPALAATLALAACGGATPQPTGEVRPAPERGKGSLDPAVAVETSRRTPVPAAEPGERVVFVRGGSVWLIDQGKPPAQLTVRPIASPDERPVLSPDGKLIAFAALKDGAYRIHLMLIDELVPVAVTDGHDGGDGEPTFAPDGRTLFFMRGDPRDKKDLFRLDLAAALELSATGALAVPELLLEGDDDAPEQAGAPTVTPDGAAVLLSADRRAGRGTGLYRFDLRSRALSRITAVVGPRAIDREPTVSPDGTRVVFASNRHVAQRTPADEFDLYAVALDGSGLTRLTDDPGSAYDPAFSPDGKRLFFVSTRDRQSGFEEEVYVMAAGGGLQERLTRDDRPQNRAPFVGRVR